jgi:hypothetical protein
MVDPNNRQLRPPIHRSWLRLRLGKLYYGGAVFCGCRPGFTGPNSVRRSACRIC